MPLLFRRKAIFESVLWHGYSRVILKSDNEPAIMKLLQEALGALKVKGIDQATEEHPPPYDPQANWGHGGCCETGEVAAENLEALPREEKSQENPAQAPYHSMVGCLLRSTHP